MTATAETEAINQALAIIDASLGTLHTRELVSTAEVTDILLDMRSLLGAAELADLDSLATLESAAN